MSVFGVVLLVAALALLVASLWPRLAHRAGIDSGSRRARARRRSHLRVVESETDEFARAVERDLAKLPTIEDRD